MIFEAVIAGIFVISITALTYVLLTMPILAIPNIIIFLFLLVVVLGSGFLCLGAYLIASDLKNTEIKLVETNKLTVDENKILKEYVAKSQPYQNNPVPFQINPDDVINYPAAPPHKTFGAVIPGKKIDIDPLKLQSYKNKYAIIRVINMFSECGYDVTIDYADKRLCFYKPNEAWNYIDLESIE